MSPAAPLRRLALAATTVATAAVLGLSLGGGALVSADSAFPKPVPEADCGPGSRPETDIQGRVPLADYVSGRAAEGYTCNTRQIAHEGGSGGFKVLRYTDEQGRTCAYYDNTLIVPRDVLGNLTTGEGTVVLDMTDPRRPVRTTTLDTPTMTSPHESLLVNQRRGLLAGVLGTAATYPGVLEVWDVSQDCRDPQLLSRTLAGVLGHESGWSRDGRTFYSSSAVASLAAIDLTDPTDPQVLTTQWGVNYHGLRLSDDGRTLYAANLGTPGPTGLTGGGLAVLDVSEVQDRVADPAMSVVSTLTWPEHSIPQVAEPFTRDGRHYLLEIDEFVDVFELTGLASYPGSPVGVARIIDVEDPARPRVVSNIRLEVHQPENRAGDQLTDPGAWFPAQGYAGHYCSLPTRTDPALAGCSMIASGLRLFDIRDVRHPREVAYFNQPLVPLEALKPPTLGGAYAMSAPAYDRRRGEVWYTDTNTGFYNVRLTNGVARLLR
ncbi:MAG TPA: hypothetical protein VGE43_08685 [Acidimicrobiales bacterium]